MMKHSSLVFVCSILLALTSYSQTILESRSGKFSAHIERTGSAKTWPESNEWTATVMSADGTQLYTLQKEVPFDFQFPAIHLSDLDGSAVVVFSAHGMIEWYSPLGNRITALYPFGSHTPDYERVIKCSVAEDRIAFLVSSPEMVSAQIYCATMEGEKLWTVELPFQNAGEVMMSPSGRYVLAGTYASEGEIAKKTFVIDRDGHILQELPGLFRYADVDERTETIAFAERNSVIKRRIQGVASSIWETGKRETIITDIQFIDENVLVTVESVLVEGGTIRYVNPSLVLLDHHARIVSRKDLHSVSTSPLNVRRRENSIVMDLGGIQTEMKISELFSQQ